MSSKGPYVKAWSQLDIIDKYWNLLGSEVSSHQEHTLKGNYETRIFPLLTFQTDEQPSSTTYIQNDGPASLQLQKQ